MRRTGHLFIVLLAALLHAACDDSTQGPLPGTGGEAGFTSTATGGAATGGTGGAATGGTGGAGGTSSQTAMCSSDIVTDDYAPELTKVGDKGYTVVLLQSDPAPPIEGDNAWTVRVLDPDGKAQSDLTIDVYPFMPDHGHGTAVKAVVTPSGADGTYEIAPVNLFMSGVWVVRLKLLDPVSEAELDFVKYSFCVGP